MRITYRKLTAGDLDIFIQMRINQLREEGASEDIIRFARKTVTGI